MRKVIRILIYSILLAILTVVVVLAALVLRTPGWYQPRHYSDEQLNNFANNLVSETGRFLDQAGMGPADEPFVVEVTEEQFNGYLHAVAKMAGSGLPSWLRDPAIVILKDRLVLAGKHEKTGDRPISLHLRLVVTPDAVDVRIESIQVGSLPLPRQFITDQLSEIRNRLDQALRRRAEASTKEQDRTTRMMTDLGVAFFEAINGQPMKRTFSDAAWGNRPIRLEKIELAEEEREVSVSGKTQKSVVPLMRLTFVPEGAPVEGGHWH
ncbi:MAG: hypothetical protein BIFFINMI_01410 [Phycisphaerae bacterium]|nr:hypothetical protein [Phycisphaerae bacterium]